MRNKLISLLLVFSLIHVSTQSAHAGFWSKVKSVGKTIGKGALYGGGFAIGSRIVNGVMDWAFGSSSNSSSGISTSTYKKGINKVISNNNENYSRANKRLNDIENQILSLSTKVTNIENKVENIEEILIEVQKTQLAQGEQIKLNSLMLERIQISLMRERVLEEITSGAKAAFNKDSESASAFIKKQMQLIDQINNPLERNERFTLLSAIIGETQALVNSVDDNGHSILSVYEKSEILGLTELYQEEVKNIKRIDDNTKNQYADSIELGLIEAQSQGVNQLQKDWSTYLSQTSSIAPNKLKKSEKQALDILDESSTPLIRDLFDDFQKYLSAPLGMDEALILYRDLLSEIKNLNISNSDYKKLRKYLDHMLNTKQDQFGKESSFLLSAQVELKNKKDDFFHKLYLRDVAGPCLAFLKEKIPGISDRYLKDLVELSMLKLAWAYADATEDNTSDYEERINDIYTFMDINKSNQVLLEEYLANVENQNFNEDTLIKIQEIQKEKYPDRSKDIYMINHLDTYTVELSQKVSDDLSLVGLLELIHSAYNHPEYTGYPKAKFEKSIKSLSNKINEYNDEIKSLLETNQCSEYNKIMQTCHKLDKNFEYISLITQIEDLQETVNDVKSENLNLKSYEFNNKKAVEKEKQIAAHNNWKQKQAIIAAQKQKELEEKQAKEKAKRYETCKNAKSELTGNIIYVYKNHKLTQYSKILQPGLRVKIDYPSRVSLNSVLIKDINGNHIGWVSPSTIDLGSNQACLKELF